MQQKGTESAKSKCLSCVLLCICTASILRTPTAYAGGSDWASVFAPHSGQNFAPWRAHAVHRHIAFSWSNRIPSRTLPPLEVGSAFYARHLATCIIRSATAQNLASAVLALPQLGTVLPMCLPPPYRRRFVCPPVPKACAIWFPTQIRHLGRLQAGTAALHSGLHHAGRRQPETSYLVDVSYRTIWRLSIAGSTSAAG